MIKRPLVVVAHLALLLILLSACNLTGSTQSNASPAPSAAAGVAAASAAPIASAAPTATPAPSATAAPTPASIPRGGALPIRIAADVPDLKPWDLRSRGEEYVADLLFSGLIRLDDRLQPQPDLAERFATSSDGRTLTFTLNDNARWHDGQLLTADDVVWTLNTLRAMTPSNALLSDLRTYITDLRATAPDTVTITLTDPYAPLLAELAVPILPRHRLESRSPDEIANINFWSEPVGSGPFKLDQRQPDQSIAFIRNNEFYRNAPYLDEIVLVVAPDSAVATSALRDGQLLLSEFAGAVAPQSDPAVNLVAGSYPENGWYGVVFNMRGDRLFADGRLREALARAINLPELVQNVTGGVGQPIASTLSQAAWAYPADLAPAPQDVAAAQQLLDEAGWTPGGDGVRQKNGQPLSARLWVRGDDPRRVAAAEQLAAAAQTIGMRLEVTPASFDTVILAKLNPPYDFDLILGSWVNAPNSAGFPTNRFYDPEDFALFHSSRVWQGQGDTRVALRNVGGFSNGEYDQAAEAARRAYNLDDRAQAIKQAQAVLARERPYLLLWGDRIPVVISGRVQSVDGAINLDSPRYFWNVEQWFLAE